MPPLYSSAAAAQLLNCLHRRRILAWSNQSERPAQVPLLLSTLSNHVTEKILQVLYTREGMTLKKDSILVSLIEDWIGWKVCRLGILHALWWDICLNENHERSRLQKKTLCLSFLEYSRCCYTLFRNLWCRWESSRLNLKFRFETFKDSWEGKLRFLKKKILGFSIW